MRTFLDSLGVREPGNLVILSIYFLSCLLTSPNLTEWNVYKNSEHKKCTMCTKWSKVQIGYLLIKVHKVYFVDQGEQKIPWGQRCTLDTLWSKVCNDYLGVWGAQWKHYSCYLHNCQTYIADIEQCFLYLCQIEFKTNGWFVMTLAFDLALYFLLPN